MNYENINIILNIFYSPTEQLKEFIEQNYNRNGHLYFPINGGASLKNDPWCRKHLQFDDEGDNISNLNNLLNEMTSIYWYWKNVKNEYSHVGFNHYRRLFRLDDIEDYQNYDIIVSKPIWSSNKISLAHQYRHYHILQDLQICIDVIRSDFNYSWGEGFRKYLLTTGTNLAPCNMFIMRKELFNEWCGFIFPILFKLKDVICSSSEFQSRDNYQKRALCFLTERMFNYWYYLKKNSGLKCKEIDMDERLEYKPAGVNERGDFSKQLPKVALVAIAKDEDEYLKEWVDYHLSIGFDEIFIYQNNWRYVKNDIADPRVHLEILDGCRQQNSCYNSFIDKYHTKFDFAAFFDIDEFLYIKSKKPVPEFLLDYTNEPSLFINWRLFGDNGLSSVKNNDYSVIRRFTKCDDKLFPLGKQIINLKLTGNSVIFNNPHILQPRNKLIEFKSADPALTTKCVCGCIHGNLADEPCELYHFRDKTWEENIKRKFNTDDAYHDANKCDFRRDMAAIRREFDKHNANVLDNYNLFNYKNCIVLHSGNNERYFKYVSFMLKQLKSFGIDIFILTTKNISIPQEVISEWKRINKKATCVNVDSLLYNLGLGDEMYDHYSRMTFLKLLSPFHNIISKYDKVLYMDTDILVLNNFMDIFLIDMGQNMLGAVEDWNMSAHGHMTNHVASLKKNLANFDIDYINEKYYNCGLIMFNIPFIKSHMDVYREHITKLINLKYKYPQIFPFPDQDILNAVIRFIEFPMEYNVLRGFTKISDDKKMKLLHYISVKADFDKIVQKELESNHE